MFGFIEKLFSRKPQSVDDILKKEGVTREQLEQLGQLSFELKVNDTNREKVSKLSEMKDVKIEKGSSQLMGSQILSITADAYTALQLLNCLGGLAVISVVRNGGKIKMSVKDVIRDLLGKAGRK